MEPLASEILNLRKRGKQILYCGIRHQGTVLMDQWFEDVDTEAPQPVFSVSKTITALLVGKVLEQGHIRALDVPLRELLPEYGDLIPERLRLDHLLTMTAGIEWPEIATFGSDAGVFRRFLNAEDPVRFIFEQPVAAPPGKEYAYNSAVSHLLMILLNRAAGVNPQDYARTVLWEPLGLSDSHWAWKTDRNGIPYGGHGLSLTAEGMNRIGSLLLGYGQYEERQVVLASYIKDLSTVHISGTRGYKGYGYQTWIGETGGKHFFGAFGHGGQRIYVFPDQELQVVFLGQNVRPEFGLHERLLKHCLLQQI